jgi:hypothetical protein
MRHIRSWILFLLAICIIALVLGCSAATPPRSSAPFAITPPYLAADLTRIAITRATAPIATSTPQVFVAGVTSPPMPPITPILSGTVTPVLPVRWLTPQTTPAPTITSIPPNTIEWANYTNVSGNYTLRYPATWSGVDIGADVGFETPEDFSIEITVDRAPPGMSAIDYARDPDWLGSSQVLSSTATETGGENAIRLQVAEQGNKQMTAILYLAIHNNQVYLFALRGVTARSPEELATVVQLFDELVKSFRFTR